MLLWSLEPLLILFLAAWFLRERITPTFVALSIVAVAGMVVIIYDPSSGGGQWIGVALTLAGIVCCAAYSVITRRWIPDARETSQVILAQQAHALALALGLVVVVGLAGGAIVPTSLTPLGLASAVGSGALYYAGAYWFYLGALRHVPASFAAVSFYLIPIVGVAASAAAIGRAARSAAVGGCGHRPRCRPGHHPPAIGPTEVALHRRVGDDICRTVVTDCVPAAARAHGTGDRDHYPVCVP